jgi:putative membrane protein
MTRFLLRLVVSALGLWLASKIVPGIRVDGWGSLAAAALLLGIVNALVRPVLVILTLPFTIITLGLFLLVINAAMLSLVAFFLHGFHLDGFWAALLGGIVVGLVSWVGHAAIGKKR